MDSCFVSVLHLLIIISSNSGKLSAWNTCHCLKTSTVIDTAEGFETSFLHDVRQIWLAWHNFNELAKVFLWILVSVYLVIIDLDCGLYAFVMIYNQLGPK